MNCCHICLQPLDAQFRFNDLLFTKEDMLLCHECQQNFVPISHEVGRCQGCLQVSESTLCLNCENCWGKYRVRVEHDALFAYNEGTRNYMWQIKAFGDCAASDYVAVKLKRLLMLYMKASDGPVDLVVIPGYRESERQRGFCLMAYVVETMGFAVAHYLTRIEQQDHDAPLFSFVGKRGSQVILLDDIYKTGTTLLQAKQCCEENQCIVLRTVSFFR